MCIYCMLLVLIYECVQQVACKKNRRAQCLCCVRADTTHTHTHNTFIKVWRRRSTYVFFKVNHCWILHTIYAASRTHTLLQTNSERRHIREHANANNMCALNKESCRNCILQTRACMNWLEIIKLNLLYLKIFTWKALLVLYIIYIAHTFVHNKYQFIYNKYNIVNE